MSQADQLADPQTMKFLVGNKADLAGQRAISEEECQSAATQFDCQYFETSALTDLNIEKLFTEIARATVKRAEHFQHNAGNVKSKNQKNENNDSCC
ncbi:hypothetical protein TRFO_41126 [Tritrichomonas foetus]|uniref:Uncharacterized protein n=1 Tax=Tritrichomonas foetus TaxID=1144522 RepID=A0A1J4L2H4_9EUKA|nr:hypothetical protein TRFO_41126 [Tritrichomonas foetus]|eukprot:OHT17288.1 hypothetical protein TRFO_41126 [Tritrichomonas foetus]